MRALHLWRTVWSKLESWSAHYKTKSGRAVVIGNQIWCWEVWWAFWKILFDLGEPQNVRNAFLFQRDYCTKVIYTNEDFALYLTFPQNGNPRELFVHDVSLRSLMNLFDWGHLFVKYVARGKFCKSRKFGFWSFLRSLRCGESNDTLYLFPSFMVMEK